MPTASLTDLKWHPGELLSIECSKAQLVYRYEISDLFLTKWSGS